MRKKKTCLICKTVFMQNTHNQLYCSKECALKAKRIEHKSVKQFINKPIDTYTCSWCGKTFESAHAKKFCSSICNQYANGARKTIRQNKTASELARVNQLARDAGLSYGRYVGREYAKLISHNTKENEK